MLNAILVSALNDSSPPNETITILPVESLGGENISAEIIITEPPTQEIHSESPASAAISIQPIPSDENQNVPIETPTVTIPEAPVEETIVPPVEEPAPPVEASLVFTFLNLVLDKVKFFVGEIIEIQTTLTDQNSNPIPDKSIAFYADEQVIGTNLTDSAGTAKVSWNTSSWLPGAYTIKADYAGDETSELVSATRLVILGGDVSSNLTTEALPIPENVSELVLEDEYVVENKRLNEFDSKVLENLDNYLKSFVNEDDLQNNFRLKKSLTRVNKGGSKENVFIYQFVIWKDFPDGVKAGLSHYLEIKTDEFGTIKDPAISKQRYEFLKARGVQ